MEKLSSMKPAPGAKEVGTLLLKGCLPEVKLNGVSDRPLSDHGTLAGYLMTPYLFCCLSLALLTTSELGWFLHTFVDYTFVNN